MLARMRRNYNPHILLVEMKNNTTTVEKCGSSSES